LFSCLAVEILVSSQRNAQLKKVERVEKVEEIEFITPKGWKDYRLSEVEDDAEGVTIRD
jgi:hypothetical protein